MGSNTPDSLPDSVNSSDSKHISCLFPEILTMIVGHLDICDKGRAAQVCRAWKEAAYNRRVWRSVVAKLHLRRANPSLFPSLVRRGIKRVQILSLKRSLRDLIVDGMPTVESLNLSGCYNLTDATLGHALSQDLPSLTTLNLSLCKQITDSTLGRIASYVKNLESLDVGGCNNVTSNGVLLIACGLQKLKVLNLRSCRHVSDQGIEHLSGMSNISVQGTRQLEKLVLQDCQKITDLSLKHISTGMLNLKSLNLSFCTGITDTGLRYLSKMTNLQELNVQVCDSIGDAGIGYLAAGNSRITILDLSFCERITDQTLVHISHGIFHLRTLGLGSCSITDDGIGNLVRTVRNLHSLNIGQCSKVTDAGLAMIAENLQNLETIDLYGCTKVTTVGLEKASHLPKLSTLNRRLWHKT